jgi:protein-tyrosine kinase
MTGSTSDFQEIIMKKSRLHWEHDDKYFSEKSGEFERLFESPLNTSTEPGLPEPVSGKVPSRLNGDMSGFIEPLRNAIIRSDPQATTRSRVIGLTSVKSGEGVSTIAAGLAVTFSHHQEGKILFVDCNFTDPSVHRLFSLHLSPGFSDMVRENLTPGSVVNNIDSQFLDVLTAGMFNTDDQLLTRNSQLRHMFDQLLQEYQYIILDLPSIERSNQGCMAFSSFMDGLILVVECERTRTESLKHVIESFGECRINLLGVVLNKRKFYLPDWLYNML